MPLPPAADRHRRTGNFPASLRAIGRSERRRRRHDLTSRRTLRTLIWLGFVISIPTIAGIIAGSRTAVPDLSDLVPESLYSGDYLLLAWSDLERNQGALRQGGPSTGAPVRALGYMMEGEEPLRAGQSVSRFILLPDAGSLMHPAHRFGDQMIEVRLRAGEPVRFCGRCLVWVWGTLRMLPGNPKGPKALYVLEAAHSESAAHGDIAKYFR